MKKYRLAIPVDSCSCLRQCVACLSPVHSRHFSDATRGHRAGHSVGLPDEQMAR